MKFTSFPQDLPPIELVHDGDVVSLANREADIAIRLRRVPKEGSVLVRSLGEIAFAVYGPRAWFPDLVEGRNPSRDTADDALAKRPLIGYDEASQRYSQCRWIETIAHPGQISFRTSSAELRFQATCGGLGASILPCFRGDGAAELVRLTPPIDHLTDKLYMLIHTDIAKTERVRRVKSHLFSVFKQLQPSLSGQTTRPEALRVVSRSKALESL